MRKFFYRLRLVRYFGWRGAFDRKFIKVGNVL